MSHSPYVAYATVDGTSWKAVMKEAMSEQQILPGVPGRTGHLSPELQRRGPD